MLGSISEADDALQEAWLRIHDQDPGNVENMQAWLTTIVGRVCLNMLRSRSARREELSGHVPDPIVTLDESVDPEQEALLADSVGLAMLVVLDALTPAERLAFVMHDVFGVSFADIATTLGRSEAAAQKLATALGDGYGVPQSRTSISRDSDKSSMRSLPRRATATSMRSSRCSIQTSNSGSTAACCAAMRRSFFAARRQWHGTPPRTPISLRSFGRRSSTALLGPLSPRQDGCLR
jgi:RNA polymerase sigma factor (sigma-70 family)